MEIIDVLKQEDSKVSFGIKLNRSEWEPYITETSKEMQEKEPLSGFRPGAAPLAVAENTYGERLYRLAAEKAGNEAVARACEECGFEPVSDPAFTVITAGKDGYESVVTFHNYPEITGFDYHGIEAEHPVRVVTDEDIDREAKHFMENHLYVHEVDREARMNDIAEVSFTGTTDGHSFPFDHSSKSRFIIGSGNLFAGLDEVLLGHHGGDILDLTLTMPEDFHREAIAGLTLDLHVELKGVWARDLCELNDEFVHERVKGCETVKEFRNYLKTELEKRYEGDCDKIYEENLQNAMGDAVADQVPDAMTVTVMNRIMAGAARMAEGRNMSLGELLASEGRTVEEYRDEIQPLARRQASYSVAVDAVVRDAKLTVSDEEAEEFCRSYADQTDSSEEDVMRSFGGEEGLKEEILSLKAMQLVRKYARPVYREVTCLPGEDLTMPRLYGM